MASETSWPTSDMGRGRPALMPMCMYRPPEIEAPLAVVCDTEVTRPESVTPVPGSVIVTSRRLPAALVCQAGSRPGSARIMGLIVELIHSGQVPDVYADGSDLILVASDRVSVYDVVLPTSIPDKGRILTALSLWWFERLAGIVPNHVLSATDGPLEFAGRAVRCRRLAMVPVECIARGYLAASGLDSYPALPPTS